MGKPTYILLVRHGESEGNCDKSVNRYTPNHMVPLTQQGHNQAKRAGLVLRDFLNQKCFEAKGRSVLFYTSPYRRARETCHDIMEGIKDIPNLKYKTHEEPRLREQDFGNFQSTPDEMEEIWRERATYGHFFYRIPHGESAADVYDRVASFNETLFRQFQSDDFPNVLVLVTHGIWARVFLMKWFRWSYEEFESLRNIPHCKYLIMKRQVEDDRFLLKTPLKTWDDLPDDEIDQEVEKEVGEEVTFNSGFQLDNPADLDITQIIRAQRDAIRQQIEKDKIIMQTYEKNISHTAGSGLPHAKPLERKGSSKFNDNQSVTNSPKEEEDLLANSEAEI